MANRPSARPTNRAGLLAGLALMGGLVAWGVADHLRRAQPTLLGRQPIAAPAGAAASYADLCAKAGRCEATFARLTWHVVDADTLPTGICPGAGADLVGCYELETNAITLTRAVLGDTVVVRHELLHAALGARWTGQHPCRWFNPANATAPEGACQ